MTEKPESDREPRPRNAQGYAGQVVSQLQGTYQSGVPSARATMAQLRRLDPATDEGVLEAMSIAFTDPPEEILGRGDNASREEIAVASALVLYSIHQQSKSQPMHVPGVGLGAAVRRLANPGDADSREKPVMRRFQSLNTATDIKEILYHLRGLVQQFRANDVPLDYSRLTRDLLRLQQPRSVTSVRLGWARDLSRTPKRDEDGPAAE